MHSSKHIKNSAAILMNKIQSHRSNSLLFFTLHLSKSTIFDCKIALHNFNGRRKKLNLGRKKELGFTKKEEEKISDEFLSPLKLRIFILCNCKYSKVYNNRITPYLLIEFA